MSTVTKEDHAVSNAKAQLESIVVYYKRFKELEQNDEQDIFYDELLEEAQQEILSVEVRSQSWQTPGTEEFKPDQGRLLLSWGGPACQIIFDLDEHGQPVNNGELGIQHQDWFKPWEYLQTNDEEEAALEWFAGLFWYGE
tara:strand:- start:399 stop:818 length:420 start_codon:yes stop_codon:yes gene_type:complete